MNDLRTYHQFDCHMCGTTVTLHGYPEGTYEYYGCFITCTAHNPPDAQVGLDGFMRKKLFVCNTCSGIVQSFMDDTRAKITEQPMSEPYMVGPP